MIKSQYNYVRKIPSFSEVDQPMIQTLIIIMLALYIDIRVLKCVES